MELNYNNKLNLLNYLTDPTEEILNHQAGPTQSLLDQSATNQILTPEYLIIKRFVLLNRINIDPETEQDFRRTCALYEVQNSNPDKQLKAAFKKYVKAYRKITSLYLFGRDNETFLDVYDTEEEKSKKIELRVPTKLSSVTCIAVLPNRELFCFGDLKFSGITLIIGINYEARILPSGARCHWSSAIYFNRNVYCFGGIDNEYRILPLSMRFDLDKNRWFKLAPMPTNDKLCHSVIFNRNILISGCENRNLLLYSVDLESFSVIPYHFARQTRKLIINAERLYLFECRAGGFVYESGVENEYSWWIVGKSPIEFSSQAYCLYNKGGIYAVTDTFYPRQFQFWSRSDGYGLNNK